jgi:predicted hotdog family 3-hydroxylacyl-ACP dehydratase
MPITFTKADINLISFPHTDAMVITVHIDKWNVTTVLVDHGSQAKILFLLTFGQMGFDRKQLKEAWKPLYGFGRRRIEPIGSILLLVSFGSLRNARTEYITFDVVDMNYPYNVIFSKGLLNTFKAALHFVYLCLKVPTALGVISIHGSQKDARNIEQGFALGHRNVNYLQDEKIESCNDTSATKTKESFASKAGIELECESKRVPLDLEHRTKQW